MACIQFVGSWLKMLQPLHLQRHDRLLPHQPLCNSREVMIRRDHDERPQKVDIEIDQRLRYTFVFSLNRID